MRTLAIVLLAGMAFAPVVSAEETKTVCNSSGDCFEYRCLPADKTTLSQPAENPDPKLTVCIDKAKSYANGSRVEALSKARRDCTSFGGRLRDGGKVVSCVLPAMARKGPATNKAAVKARATCPGGTGVWDENKPNGGCAGPAGGGQREAIKR